MENSQQERLALMRDALKSTALFMTRTLAGSNVIFLVSLHEEDLKEGLMFSTESAANTKEELQRMLNAWEEEFGGGTTVTEVP